MLASAEKMRRYADAFPFCPPSQYRLSNWTERCRCACIEPPGEIAASGIDTPAMPLHDMAREMSSNRLITRDGVRQHVIRSAYRQ